MRVFLNPAATAVSALLLAISFPGCAGENPESAAADGGAIDTTSFLPNTSADAGTSPGADRGFGEQPEADGGPPQLPSCASGETCPTDTVCAPMGLCVPDCRLQGQACPSQFPICDESTGVCGEGAGSDGRLPPRGDGRLPPRGDGGPPPMGRCVPDCRITERCPPRLPVCDEETGLCEP
jgi:hypothetical protein